MVQANIEQYASSESMQLRRCRHTIELFVYAITKARSLIRETVTPGRYTNPDWPRVVDEDALSEIEETAKRHDPWLFSEECERMLEDLADLKNPTPLDVMNWTMILMAPPRRFETDPYGPGDSIGLRLVFPSYNPVYSADTHPHWLMTSQGSLWNLPDQ